MIKELLSEMEGLRHRSGMFQGVAISQMLCECIALVKKHCDCPPNILNKLHNLAYAIEDIPASEEQTHASILLADITSEFGKQQPRPTAEEPKKGCDSCGNSISGGDLCAFVIEQNKKNNKLHLPLMDALRDCIGADRKYWQPKPTEHPCEPCPEHEHCQPELRDKPCMLFPEKRETAEQALTAAEVDISGVAAQMDEFNEMFEDVFKRLRKLEGVK